VIDCNKQTFTDRRLLQRGQRKEKLSLDIREVDRSTWPYFSKYHYLSERLPGGFIATFGLFCNDDQIGFQCFANYVPHRSTVKRKIMHSNRTVIHPDYAGLGMGIILINKTSMIMSERGFDVRAKFSSTPVYLAMKRQSCWELKNVQRATKILIGCNMIRATGFRQDVKTYSFKFNAQNYVDG
jgi:hypothetical protein